MWGSVLFSIGLIAIVTLKLNLFTGKAQFVWGMPRGKWNAENSYMWLLGILVLNFLGCMLTASLVGNAEYQTAAVAIIGKRLAVSPLKNGLLAIGCGWLMTLAVQGVAKNNWLPLLFGIPAFIICGFPHCVADAFYLSSLPLDYIAGQWQSLLLFYVSIVIGNFLGCNAYRLVNPPVKAAMPAPEQDILQADTLPQEAKYKDRMPK